MYIRRVSQTDKSEASVISLSKPGRQDACTGGALVQ